MKAGRWREILILFSGFLLSTFLFTIVGCRNIQGDPPVEPVVPEENGNRSFFLKGRFSFNNPDMNIFDLSLDREGNAILFGSSAEVVSLLDREGKLRWEMPVGSLPYKTKITPDGRYIAIGTSAGTLYLLEVKEESDSAVITLWEKELEKEIQHLAISEDGEFLTVGTGTAEEGSNTIYAFNREGEELWQAEKNTICSLALSASGKDLYLSEVAEEGTRLARYDNTSGELLWEKEGLVFASFTPDGENLAAIRAEQVVYLDKSGEELWARTLAVAPTRVEMSRNGEYIAAYSEFGGGKENLFFFDQDGERLWQKRIPDGSLISIASEGERIISASWREYSDDLSSIIVFNNRGEEVQTMEVASRIDKMSLTENARYLSLAGRDGNIYIFDLFAPREEPDREQRHVYYRPVSSEIHPEETKVTLYFYDQDARELVPVTRTVSHTKSVLQTAINELISGPRRYSNLSRPIPKESEIEVSLEMGTAYINLPESLSNLGGATQNIGMINSLLHTASQFPSVREVQFLVEGEKREYIGEGLEIADPYPSVRFDKDDIVLYLPYASGERYYLLPRTAASLGIKAGTTPKQLIECILQAARVLELPELGVRSVEIGEQEIVVDFADNFRKLFPAAELGEEAADEQEKMEESYARATLIVDALVYSLVENYEPDRVRITIEGEQWPPPEGYPPLEKTVKRPYYINPES
ncbi:MAG: GerMN domain-containing protein [Dethiobacteria bacterium]|jgi:outer membrane protein assembly factor BamB|nr:PQQ-binding-like beta-propeller repeat protein [Bacillota bacterium]